MKKTRLICFLITITTIYSCGESGNSSSKRPTDSTATIPVKTDTIGGAAAAPAIKTATINLTSDGTTMELHATAKANIVNYIGPITKNTSAYSFTFSVDANLKSYVGNALISYIHFILAQDGSQQLMMYISGTDNIGNHVYIHDNSSGTSKFYVFKNIESDGFALPRQAPLAGDPFVSMNSAYSKNTLEINTDATGWINDYKTNPSSDKNTTAYSFILASSVLNQYLNASANIKKLRLYLSENSKKLAVIIVAQDGTGKEIYIKDPGTNKYYGLEYCNPCPQCVEIPGRAPLQFEDPGQQVKHHIHYRDDLKEKFIESYK